MTTAFSLTTFLGKGFAFPFRQDTATGDVKRAEGQENIKGSIQMFFSTRQGERVLLENYGMPAILFEDDTEATADIIEYAAREGLNRFEPRIQVLDVRIKNAVDVNGLNGIGVYVRYKIRSTGEEDSDVFHVAGGVI